MFKRPSFSLRNTIFVRLIVTFLLIMLPIITSGVYLYHWIIQTTSDDIAKSAVSQISFYLTDLENEIERIKLLQYSLLDDEDLNKLALTWDTMNTIERTDIINLLSKRLYYIQNSSMYIKDVSVHIYPILKSISSANGPRPLDTDLYYGTQSGFRGGSQVMEWRGGLYLSVAKQGAIKGSQPLFIIYIELDTQKLQEALNQFNTYTGSGTLLILDNTGFSIASGALSDMQKDAVAVVRSEKQAMLEKAKTYEVSGNRYYTVHSSSKKLHISIFRFIPDQVIRKPLDKFYVWAWLFAAVTLLIIAVYAVSSYKFIHKPLLTLVKSFKRMENGDLNLVIEHEARDEFGYLYGRFNQMVGTLRSLIDQVYKQKIMAQRAELKQLQSQINPHFLYNSFFTLNSMAMMGDLERIRQFTTQLGEYFQFVTRSASDEVSLKQEIHHARLYTEIQKLRFSRRVKVQFDVLPMEMEQILVPRLIVQPIIENAFGHSLEQKVHSGFIAIRFDMSETEVCIIVEDNGDSLTDQALLRIENSLMSSDERLETTGMVNIHRRIKITFGEQYGLEVSRSELGGLMVRIHFPRKGSDTHVQNVDS